jgi:alkylated DNA repair dioxygenase AlkB
MADMELQVSPALLKSLYSDISQLDEKIASASGNDSAGKRAIANAIAADTSEDWDVDEYLTAKAEENKSDAPEVSDEELNTLLATRREKTDQYKSIRNILEMFGSDVSDIPEPKRMTGSRGPRGPRTLSNFDYSVNGEPRSKSQNSLSSIASTVCGPLGWKTKELREYLVSQGLNITEPPETWSYDLPAFPDGKVVTISAVKSADAPEEPESDTEPDEDED